MVVQALCSSLAGVFTERLIKGNQGEGAPSATAPRATVNLQNAALYLWTGVCNTGWMLFRGTLGDATRASNLHVLASPIVFGIILLSSTGGIVTGYFLKHLDSIRRTIASAVEVFFCVLAAWLFFDVPITAATVVAAGLVGTGVCLYSSTDGQRYLSYKGFAALSLGVGVLAATVHYLHPASLPMPIASPVSLVKLPPSSSLRSTIHRGTYQTMPTLTPSAGGGGAAVASGNAVWTQIWDARAAKRADKPLHWVDGFEYPPGTYEVLTGYHLRRSRLTNRSSSAVKVLDAGCGAGAFLESVIRAAPRAHVYGFDVSAEMVKLAQLRLGRRGARMNPRLGAPHVRVASLQGALPYPDAFFDATYAMGAFQYLDTVEFALAAYREMLRITKAKDGVVLVGIIPHPKRRKEEARVRGSKESNHDQASSLAAPKHLYMPHVPLSKLCEAHGGRATFLPLWEAEEQLRAMVKQSAYWYSHMCELGAKQTP